MTGPTGNSEFCFKQNSLFPWEPGKPLLIKKKLLLVFYFFLLEEGGGGQEEGSQSLIVNSNLIGQNHNQSNSTSNVNPRKQTSKGETYT